MTCRGLELVDAAVVEVGSPVDEADQIIHLPEPQAAVGKGQGAEVAIARVVPERDLEVGRSHVIAEIPKRSGDRGREVGAAARDAAGCEKVNRAPDVVRALVSPALVPGEGAGKGPRAGPVR